MTKNNIFKTLALTLSISLLAPLFANKVYAKESAPSVVSESGVIVDYETGEIIYEKNADKKMYLASTTKIMTALLFAEKMQKSDNLTYTQTAKKQPPYTIDSEKMKPYGKELKVGDIIDADTAMKGLLVYSGNDFAYMIAEAVGGDSQTFIRMMNDKAKELGLTNTTFGNPNGLPENGTDVNISTAYELAVLTKVAFENDWIRETMQLKDPKVTLPGNTVVVLEHKNTELNKNGNIGGKTGVTDQAGTCFAGVYERNGRKFIGTVLKSDRNNNETRFDDLNKMVTYSNSAEKEIYKPAGEEVDSVELEYKLFKFFGPTKTITVPITLAEDITLYDNSLNKNNVKISISSEMNDAWKAASSKEVPLTVSVLNSTEEAKGTVGISTFDIIKANLFVYIALLIAIVVILSLIFFIIKIFSNRNRRSKNRKARRRRR